MDADSATVSLFAADLSVRFPFFFRGGRIVVVILRVTCRLVCGVGFRERLVRTVSGVARIRGRGDRTARRKQFADVIFAQPAAGRGRASAEDSPATAAGFFPVTVLPPHQAQ